MKPLKAEYTKETDIPEEHKGFYAQVGDKWVLQAEGLVSKGQLDEYRNNNVSLLKKIQDLQDQYGNIDPKKYQELLDAQVKAEEDALKAKGQYDELERRLKTTHEDQTKGLNSTISLLKQSLKERVLDAITANAVNEVAVLKHPGNLRYVQMDARQFIDIEDFDKLITSPEGLAQLEQKIIVRGQDGKPRFNKEGKPMSPAEYLADFFAGAGAGLVGDSKGSGAPGGKPIITPGAKNITSSQLNTGGYGGDLIADLASGTVNVVQG